MYIISVLACMALIALDQYTKLLAVNNLKTGADIHIIDGFFSLTYVENSGIAFGLLQGGRIFFITVSLIIIASIVYFFVKLPRNKVCSFLRAALVMILAGALGNLIDRSLNGYVVDFFQIHLLNFPVFNVADSLVVTGSILFAIIMIFFVKVEDEIFNGIFSRKTASQIEDEIDMKMTIEEFEDSVEK